MSVRLKSRQTHAVSISLFFLMASIAGCAIAADALRQGMHIRYELGSPWAIKQQKQTNEIFTQLCAEQGTPFRFIGAVELVGTGYSDIYYAPNKLYFAEYTETYMAKQDSLCQFSLVKTPKIVIHHFPAQGNRSGAHYVYEASGHEAPRWRKRDVLTLHQYARLGNALQQAANTPRITKDKESRAGHECAQWEQRAGDNIFSGCALKLDKARYLKANMPFIEEFNLTSSWVDAKTGNIFSNKSALLIELSKELPENLFFPDAKALKAL